jgi:hypothetical protein
MFVFDKYFYKKKSFGVFEGVKKHQAILKGFSEEFDKSYIVGMI